jgi:probable F420-dependent oxidoreductase
LKFGYILPNFGDKISSTELLDLAELCEAEGYDSVWVTDHVIMPVELREPYGQVLEPLTTLSVIAGRTRKLKLGTSIIVLPQRNPILVAKQVATLDNYSRGRVILGLGAGWAEKEYAFLNSDFAARGRVFDEGIRLMKALWKEETVNFDGEFFHVKDSLFMPKPTNGTIPIWIGGNGRTAVNRVVRLGDGWHPVGPSLEVFRTGVEKVRGAGKEVTFSVRMTTDLRKKRDVVTLPSGEKRAVASGSADDIRKTIGEFEQVGLDYFCASIMHPSAADILADLKKFAVDVVRSYG